MVNYHLVSKIIGQLLLLECVIMMLCWGVSVGYGEDDSMPFLLSSIITAGGGILFKFFGRN